MIFLFAGLTLPVVCVAWDLVRYSIFRRDAGNRLSVRYFMLAKLVLFSSFVVLVVSDRVDTQPIYVLSRFLEFSLIGYRSV